MAWLKLIRLPTVFTAMADIFLGFLIVSGGRFEPLREFGLLLGSSSCLYFAGMVFNDVFDVKQDTRERPHRPIPSGAVSLTSAWLFGLILMGSGVGLAALVGTPSVSIAILIVVAVFSYDWLLKPTAFAPLAMGSCRVLNVCLGASFVETLPAVFSPPQVTAAICLGVYITGLTWFARREAVGENKQDLVGGTIVMNIAVIGLCGLVISQSKANQWQVVGLLVFILGTIDLRLVKAIRSGQPPDIGSGIRTALLSLVLIDASLVLALTASVPAAIATAALLLPASIVRRWIPLT
ncbi:MAG: UbiA family prenyltransferase [Planctomycetaceae bacterium]